jgi:hypothetical protein
MNRKQAVWLSFAVVGAFAAWQAMASMLFLAVLGFWSAYPWPDRLGMWAVYALEAPPNVIVHRWLIITGVLPMVPLLLAVPLVARRRQSTKAVYGETSWATSADMAKGGIASDRGPF